MGMLHTKSLVHQIRRAWQQPSLCFVPAKLLLTLSLPGPLVSTHMHVLFQDAAKTNLAFVAVTDPLAQAGFIEVGDV